MKGPVPSHKPIKNNGRDQGSIGLSRTLAWEESGGWTSQSSDSPWAVRFLVRGNQPALRAMGGDSSSVIPFVVKQSIISRAVKPKPKNWVDTGMTIKSIRELIESHRGPTLEEQSLEGVSDRNGSPVVDQTLRKYVSLIHSEDCNRVESESTDPLILPRGFSWDWGRIPGDGIGEWVCRQRRSAKWRSPSQNVGSWGKTPVHRWNRHG